MLNIPKAGFLWNSLVRAGYSCIINTEAPLEDCLDREGDNMKYCIPAALLLLAGAASAWQELEVDGFLLKWQTQPGENLAVELTGPTTGWVAVGFDPAMMMMEANIIIGYVSEGNAYIRDDWGTHATSHQADTALGGTDDVTVLGGFESGGSTQIQFSIPLDSGDPYDKPLVPGETYTVLLARGPDGAKDFTTYHEFYTTAQITILEEQSFPPVSWGSLKTCLDPR